VRGEWLLAREVGELGEEQRAELLEALATLEPPARRHARRAAPRRRPDHPALEALVGQSAALVEVLEQVLALAPSRLPVLLQGEPGVGKELLARAVHRASGRSGAFVALDMGAMPEALAESALFGHKKGAFTGASQDRRGAFRSADGGTLFLDELGNLSPALQAKLLRVLQEGRVQPLGQDQPIEVDVRVVTASNADVRSMVRRGLFREDLLGRLDAATVHVPPLRQRLEDLDLLARAFLAREWGAEAPEPWCSPEARGALLRHDWPGNVRELHNVLRLAATLASAGRCLEPSDLGPLSPWHQRRAPILTTHTSASREGWGMERAQVQRLTLTSLHVPPLRDRAPAARRAAVLSWLGGRPIEPDALRLLEEHPWWGNLSELQATLAVLEHAAPGPLDLDTVQRHLPHLMQATGFAPIRTLLVPRRGALGRVVGLTQDFEANALLVGRVSRLEDLARAERRGDARAAMWLRELERRAGEGLIACLDLGLLPRLSRAHLLVTRDAAGLCLHRLPGARLSVQATSLGQEQRLEEVSEGEQMSLGRAGAVRVLSPSGQTYLEMFLFAGAVAYEEFSAWALGLDQSQMSLMQATVSQTAGVEASRPSPVSAGLRVWGLGPGEVEALNAAVASFRGGQLKQHTLLALSGGSTTRLRQFLEQAPRFSQYLVRLYELPENGRLRRDLRRRLRDDPEGELRLNLLPRGLRRCVTSP
jgi:transcriptional regulator with GAF, ATPase, and Fis domain